MNVNPAPAAPDGGGGGVDNAVALMAEFAELHEHWSHNQAELEASIRWLKDRSPEDLQELCRVIHDNDHARDGSTYLCHCHKPLVRLVGDPLVHGEATFTYVTDWHADVELGHGHVLHKVEVPEGSTALLFVGRPAGEENEASNVYVPVVPYAVAGEDVAMVAGSPVYCTDHPLVQLGIGFKSGPHALVPDPKCLAPEPVGCARRIKARNPQDRQQFFVFVEYECVVLVLDAEGNAVQRVGPASMRFMEVRLPSPEQQEAAAAAVHHHQPPEAFYAEDFMALFRRCDARHRETLIQIAKGLMDV